VIAITGWDLNVAYKVNNNKEIERLAVYLIVKPGVKINNLNFHLPSCAQLAGV